MNQTELFKPGNLEDRKYVVVRKPTPFKAFQCSGGMFQLPNGELKINAGDWIIKGIQGETYVVPDYVFKLTYEIVEEVEGHVN